MERELEKIYKTKQYTPSELESFTDVKMLVSTGVWKRRIFRQLYRSCKGEEEFTNMYIVEMHKKSEFKTLTEPYMPTADELKDVEIMDTLFAEYKKIAETKEWEEKKEIEKLSYFTKYLEFVKKYAIQTRYLILQGTYDKNAFKHYLRDLRIQGTRTQDEWCKLQARYVVYLTRECGKLEPAEEMKTFGECWTGLKKEFSDFKKEHERAKVVYEERVAARARDMRDRLIAMVKNNPTVAKTVASVLQTQPLPLTPPM